MYIILAKCCLYILTMTHKDLKVYTQYGVFYLCYTTLRS